MIALLIKVQLKVESKELSSVSTLTSEVLRIFPEAPTSGGSGNFLGGSDVCTDK
jgi:hypothetical protein